MDVVDVQIVRTETIESSFDLGRHDLSGQADPLAARQSKEDLAGDDEVLTVLALQPPADVLLAAATASIHVGGVDEVDSTIPRRVQDRTSLLLGDDLGAGRRVLAEHPGTQASLRDLHPGTTQPDVLNHGDPSG